MRAGMAVIGIFLAAAAMLAWFGLNLFSDKFSVADDLTRIIQPVARGDEKMQFERYDIVLLLPRGRASSSPVVDQRCDLHLFVG
jgi:hypothetical protein